VAYPASVLRVGALVCLSVVAACDRGPVSDARADAICSDRARAAAAPQGRIGLGGGTSGFTGGISISVSADYLAGRNPDEVYATCFADLTGRSLQEVR
jgi:hypothetical protein